MDWKNKTVIITGASTGIGKATKDLLRSRDAHVFNLDMAMAPDDLPEYYVSCDVRDRHNIREAVQSVHDKTGCIDMLFANAGIHLFAGIEETSEEDFDNIIQTNISGTWYVLKSVLPIMKAQQRGTIVLMGSDQTHIGKSRSAAYGLTKGAIGQLTKSTAIDYARFNIRVNCICPGTINTPLLERAIDRYHSITGERKEDIIKGLEQAQPINRIADPMEIATVVAFLLSDESSFMTGSLVSADGGYVSQ
jgi:NAD(P)-dependent dehydrogenase (short-subunit alcohol dehydrogenase family)